MTHLLNIISDGWIYKYQKFGGINTYFDRLMAYTAHQCRWQVTLDKVLPDLTFRKSTPTFDYNFRSGISDRFDFRMNRLKWKQKDHQVDLYHPTYYAWVSCAEPEKLKKPLVCTLHDCIHERYPEHQTKDPFTIPAKREMIAKADRLICISQNTADDIDFFYPGNNEKIRVILSGSDLAPPGHDRAATQDYFAFVGNRSGYKNFRVVLDALFKCNQAGQSLKLRISGPPPTEEEKSETHKLQLQDQIEWCGFLDEADLSEFYFNAIALIYPSLYEGFGLPALDVMASGSTVIAHDGSSLPEVVGKGGLLVDCTHSEIVAEAMMSLMNTHTRTGLQKEANRQAQLLTWNSTALHTVDVYKEICS